MENIAIIGIGCRFPGASNPQAFWQLMYDGVDAITEIPAARFDVNKVYDPRPATPGKLMSRWGGFLDHVDQFDASFFGISPREAARTDPQHRVLLETAWEAMEDAGQVPDKLAATLAGVFIGVITSDYWDRQFRNPTDMDVYSTTGSARNGAAGRISYALGLRGISVAVDAACSSSLVAVHLACQSLRAGSCNLAIAGGVNIILNPDHAIGYSQGKMMAPDGRCKTFDARANGYVRSEGAGIVVLKPLSQALADGDQVYAVIRGSAANNDGHTDLFMTPSIQGQQAVLQQALRDADVRPEQLQFVETHGTGTSVGDPVELKALGSILAEGRPADRPFVVGSVKTNIGHTEGAAGMAGLIKVALCLKHKMIPPNLHFETPNPAIPWQALPLVVAQELMPWPRYANTPCLAGVSSFGIAGTNAHIILAEAPPVIPEIRKATEEAPAQILTISAQTAPALQEMAQRYQHWLTSSDGLDAALSDIAAMAGTRRTHHDFRLAITGHSHFDMATKLNAFAQNEASTGMSTGRRIASRANKIVWVFPGQGSQWLGMGRELLATVPVFRSVIEQCDAVMRKLTDWSLLEQLQADESHSRIEEIDVVQPMLFAMQIALAAVWRSWGVIPDAVVGHSMGEVAAAYVAGAISLKDAALIICGRSKLLRRTSGKGAMAAVELSLEQAQTLISDYADRVSIAVSNSPNSTVLSGDPTALQAILAQLEQNNIFGRLVKVNVASHSPQMDPLRADLLELLAAIQPQVASIPMYSTVTNSITYGENFDAHYWVRNLREPVLYAAAVQNLLAQGFDTFMEMSPHPVLVAATRQCIELYGGSGAVLSGLRRNEEEYATLLNTLGSLYTLGFPLQWEKLHTYTCHVTLPLYAWQRERYWNSLLDEEVALTGWNPAMLQGGNNTGHMLLSQRVQPALQHNSYLWENEINIKRYAYLKDHRVHGMVVLPASAYMEIALAAAKQVPGEQRYSVADLHIKKALFFPENSTQKIQATLEQSTDRQYLLQLWSLQNAGGDNEATWVQHASATLVPLTLAQNSMHSLLPQPLSVQQEWPLTITASEHYRDLRKRGIEHGPLFQGVTQIWKRGDESVAALAIPDAIAAEASAYEMHPAFFDACLQPIMTLLPEDTEEDTYVPVLVKHIHLYKPLHTTDRLWSYAYISSTAGTDVDTIEGNICLFDEQGDIVFEVRGFCLQRLDRDAEQSPEERLNKLLYTIRWEPAAPVEHVQGDILLLRKHWLIFSEGVVGSSLMEFLQAKGASCTIVTPGHNYCRLNAQHYIVNPEAPTDFAQLLSDTYVETVACHGIVYLWGMTATHETLQPHEVFSIAQKYGGVGILHLLQAINAQNWSTQPRLWLVTSGAQAVHPTEQVAALEQAPLWGLGRVIAYEHPDLSCTLLDMETRHTPEQIETLCREIWSDEKADEVALRGKIRYIARLVHSHFAEATPTIPPETTEQPLFRVDSTYMITGGLGGVGLRVAQWMVEQGARHIVLVGRSTPSEFVAAQLNVLRSLGADVRAMQADVANEQQVIHLLAEIQREQPPLRGILHSAVVLEDSILLQLDQERFLRVMPPKIDGAWNLHNCTLDQPLDFFILFSSAASLIGSPGQGNYAAANAFMDMLAQQRRALGYPAISINWGRWAEVGQATLGDRGERLDRVGFSSMKPADGLAALGQLIRQSLPQVGVMSFQWRKWRQFYPQLAQSTLFAYLEQEVTQVAEQSTENAGLNAEMLLSMEKAPQRTALESYLCEQIARVLSLSSTKLDIYQQLNRLGIDSLMSVELKNRIHADLDVVVPVAMFLQGTTLDQLMTFILQQLQATIKITEKAL